MDGTKPAVYVLASKRSGTLYFAVTGDLVKRIWQHKNDLVKALPKNTGCICWHCEMVEAIQREKQLKQWNRAWKIGLIEADPLTRFLAGHCPAIGFDRIDWIPAFAGMTIDGKAASQR